MRSMYCRAWLALLAGVTAFASTASAEPMFVADKLVLNVYSEPDQESERVASLETGDKVEVLDQLGQFMRVQLSDGREGWVGANYLTVDTPALVRLRALEKDQKAAVQKVEKDLNAQIDALKKQNETLQSEIEALKAAAQAQIAAQEEEQQAAEAALVDKVEPESTGPAINFAWLWAPFVLLAGGAGYAAGYQTLARKIQNKFGGVKIWSE
jgi:uncharacterized protein YgiM (DUF1202 family)